MKNYKNVLATTALVCAVSTGAMTTPALAAQERNSGDDAEGSTYGSTVDQRVSNDARVRQDKMTKVLPHKTLVYDGTNVSYIGQDAENTNLTETTESPADGSTSSTVDQNASNTAEVEQGNIRVLPHGTLYYEGTNESYIWQEAENHNEEITSDSSNSTLTVRHGKDKKVVDQTASNTAEVDQGNVDALPNSTVYYDGINESYIWQEAENHDSSDAPAEQTTSNTADVEQGVVTEFPNSTVYDNGTNIIETKQTEKNVDE